MNSTKLFNLNYFKQNVKKSLGLIALVSAIVPIFTILIVFLMTNDNLGQRLISFGEIAVINILGLYVVPIFISLSLFGYVFSKKSVDLINSMPLNRKTIFFTNTIGGILIITAIQLITAIGLLLCSALSSSIYIFPGLIWDIFWMLWIGYVFVFITTNLAMSFSGTFWTQVAVTLLILFLIPFYTVSFDRFSYITDYIFTENEVEMFRTSQYSGLFNNVKTFSIPSFFITQSLYTQGNYSNRSIIITAVLSIIYLCIGLYSFKRRKMENAEESFSDIRVHLLIKALTMFPMIVFVRVIPESSLNIIIYALIIVYYFLYDFIVKKKVDLKVSVLALLVIIVVLNGFCAGSEKIFTGEKSEGIRIEKNSLTGVSIKFGNDVINDYYISNEELINTIFSAAKDYYGNGYDYYPYSENNRANIKFKDKNNKYYEFTMPIYSQYYEKILSLLENDEEFMKEFRNSFSMKGVFILNHYVLDNKEITKELNDEISKVINNMTLKEILDIRKDSKYSIIKKYYDNHKIITKEYPAEITKRTLEIVSDYENKETINIISELKKRKEDNYYNITVKNDIDGEHYFEFYNDEVIDLMYRNRENKLDTTKPYYLIRGNTYDYKTNNSIEFYYFTNNIEEINSLIDKDEQENKKNYYYYDDTEDVEVVLDENDPIYDV